MLKRKMRASESVESQPAGTGGVVFDNGNVFVDFEGKRLPVGKVYVIASSEPQPLRDSAPDVAVIVKPSEETRALEHLLDTMLAELSHPNKRRQKTVTIGADEELTLRCGKSSITLTKSGKVIVKGTKIVSRSLGENKIRGAQISLN